MIHDNDQIAAKEKELTKITRYKQSLYQNWKDGEITQQEYRGMKADYERQAAELADVLARLNAERAELLNDVDKEHPALVAFAKYQSIETLTREILTDLVGTISQILLPFNKHVLIKKKQFFSVTNTPGRCLISRR